MTQMWKADVVIPVTVLKAETTEGIALNTKVMVSGVSKGRGFQGVVKRHGFHGGPKTHGQKNRLRAPGSIGATAPQRVIKGKKMAGHMGNVRVSVKNLEVAMIDSATNTVMIKGAVPGYKGANVEIKTQ